MMAILRYAFLKNMRDGSLTAIVLGPMILLVASLLGVAAFEKGTSMYPLTIDPHSSAARSAAIMAPIVVFASAFFAAMAGFWSFRSEIASRSMGSFILAARPITIQSASTLFAAAAGFAGFLATGACLFTLMNALPPDPWRLMLDAAIFCTCGAAIGAFTVTLSSEPWAMIPACILGLAFIPSLGKSRGTLPELIGVAFPILCVVVATYFLRRRCAI